MRIFEILSFIANIPLVSLPLMPSTTRQKMSRWLPILGIPFTVLHLLFEGYRWQLVPIYILTIVGGLVVILGILNPRKSIDTLSDKRYFRIGVGFLGIALLLISCAAAYVLPVPEAFPTTGPYTVGTVNIHMIDEKRREIYGNNPESPRELMVQIWYPADPQPKMERVQWMEGATQFAPAMSRWAGLPPFLLNHLNLLEANAVEGVPLTDEMDTFPVLVFAHGWSGFKEQNVFQTEELASHGYVVIAINHTYAAIATIFPNGRVIFQNENAMGGETQEDRDAASNRLVRQWAADIAFVLDELLTYSQDIPIGFSSMRLELDHVGVFGHSTGGGAIVEFCSQDDRCAAILGMDTWIEPVTKQVIMEGVNKPVLFMYSETWASTERRGRNYDFGMQYLNASSGERHQMIIEGTEHQDFSIVSLLSPFAHQLGFKGPIDGERIFEIVNKYTLSFFDKNLRNFSNPLSGTPSGEFPEVIFEVIQ
jgi:predicted dienelactone hydrolase